jgi:hypothetical protein
MYTKVKYFRKYYELGSLLEIRDIVWKVLDVQGPVTITQPGNYSRPTWKTTIAIAEEDEAIIFRIMNN